MALIKIIKKISFIFAVGVVFCLGSYIGVQANSGYVGTVFGRTTWVGYFTGIKDTNYPNSGSNDDPYVLSIKSDGLAIPHDIDTYTELIELLKGYNDSGSARNKVGSAFIVNTMLGRTAPGQGTDVSDTDWDMITAILKNRSDSNKIIWTGDVDNAPLNINSYYQGVGSGTNPNDDAFYDAYRNEAGIIIINDDGSSYQLLRRCANPVGVLSGLPAVAGWSISATSTVDKGSASVGDIVTWTHTVRNIGPGTTTSIIHSNIGLSGFTNGYGSAPDYGGGDSTSGAAAVTIRTFTDSYTVTSADSGKLLCEWANYDPSTSTGGRYGKSENSCVTVSAPVVLTDCNPIQIAVKPRTYAAVSYNPADGSHWHYDSETVPITISTSAQSWGPTTSNAPIDATDKHTTGDPYIVTFQETKSHVISYSGGDEIFDYSGRSFSPKQLNDDGTEKLDYSAHSFSPKQYTSVITNTSGPDSWQSSIGPCYDYSLTAGATLSNRYIESNSTVVVSPTVLNQSYTGKYLTHTRDTQWELNKLVIEPMIAIKTLGNTDSIIDPCNYYRGLQSGISYCSSSLPDGKSGSGIFDTNGWNGNALSSYSADIGNYDAGTKICYVFSVKARAGWNKTDSDDRWNHSSLSLSNCVTVVKKPKVQIWGGDLYTKGGVLASTSDKNINGTSSRFGSWVEYGIFSAGLVNGAASGAAFANGGLIGSSSACNYSRLSFANVKDGKTNCIIGDEKIGYYNASLPNIDVAASFPITSSTPTVTSNLDNLQGVYTATGNITISGGNIKKGQWIVINAPSADVTISGNINYTNETLNSVMDIPQVVIIANNINISKDVTNVDSWLLAKSSVNTCSSYGINVALTVNMCDQKLTINGPVSAGKIYLRRTAGSGPGLLSGDPAEIINLRADAYLWSAARATSIGKVHTVYTTELPPRF